MITYRADLLCLVNLVAIMLFYINPILVVKYILYVYLYSESTGQAVKPILQTHIEVLQTDNNKLQTWRYVSCLENIHGLPFFNE